MGRPLLGDLVPLMHYIIPLLHIWMGIFNDIDAWFMMRVDKLVWKSDDEKTFIYCIAALDTRCKDIQAEIDEWKKTADGKLRSKLLTRRNKNATKSATDLITHDCPPLTPDEEKTFLRVDQVWTDKQRIKKAFEKKRSEVRGELAKFLSELKKDNSSVYASIDQHWKDNGRDRAAYHGGKWNGIDSREGMSKPEKYYGCMRGTLIHWLNESSTEQDVDNLLEDVIDLLKKWHNVFHLLRAPKKVASEHSKLNSYIKQAMQKMRDMGFSITPKCHYIEDHVEEQCEMLDPLPISYLIEEIVEQNHQIGYREEERVKRVKDHQIRSNTKAKRIWVSRNVKVRKYIYRVNQHGKRGQYKKKSKQANESTPPIYGPRESHAVTMSQVDASSCPGRALTSRADVLRTEVERMISTASNYSPAKRQRTDTPKYLVHDVACEAIRCYMELACIEMVNKALDAFDEVPIGLMCSKM